MKAPSGPGAEVDDETRATLEERLKTIERDGKQSVEWTADLTADLKDKRIRKLRAQDSKSERQSDACRTRPG